MGAVKNTLEKEKKGMKKIIEKQKDHVVLLYTLTDLDVGMIADIINISVPTVYKILDERGINTNRKRKKFPQNDIDKAVQMYIGGCKVSDILKDTKIPESRLYKELDDRNIPRRNKFFQRQSNSKVDEAEILNRYKAGKGIMQIAEELNIKWNIVNQITSDAVKTGKVSETDIAIIRKEEKDCIDAIARLEVDKNKDIDINEVAKILDIDEQCLAKKIDSYKKQKKQGDAHERKGK